MSSFEDEHVQKVYEAIASHFSSTRFKRWPVVDKFISSLPAGSFGCDFGCGNGKNLEWNTAKLVTLGMDACYGLLSVCKEKGFEVAQGTVLKDPFRDGIFDFALSIAVIHHMRTRERRLQAIQEMIRVMRPGARGLIFVWAFEENASVRRHKLTILDGNEQDVLVPWTTNEAENAEVHQRYYHLFKKGELDELVITAGASIDLSGYDRDNYYVIFNK